MKLGIGITWGSPFMYSECVDSILGLERPNGYETKFFRGEGWCPARRHNHVCEQAMEWGADLILMFGGDEIYEPDLLKRMLLRFEEGYEVITAMVPCRGYVDWNEMKPFQPMAWALRPIEECGGRTFKSMETDSDLVKQIDPTDGDVQRVNFIGSGCILFQRGHLEALSRPWFTETVLDDDSFNRIPNQDSKFMWRLQMEAQAKVVVDTTIKIKHLHIFQIDETYSERFADWAKPGVGDSKIVKFNNPYRGSKPCVI